MRKRILHIITGLDLGGAERSLVNLLSAWKNSEIEHVVLSLSDLGYYGPKLQNMGFAVHALNLHGLRDLPFGLARLRRLVSAINADLIQGWMYHGNVAAFIAAKLMRRRIPVLWSVRQSLYDLGVEKLTTQYVIRLSRLLSGQPKAIIYNSHQSREHHESYGFSKKYGIVIPNGFDLERWQPDRARRQLFRSRLGLSDQHPVMAFVGRYHPQKDVPTFLKACAIAMKEIPNLHVVIVGKDLTADNSELLDLFTPLPSSRLHLLGSRDDIEYILPGCDFFCISSSSEAFPNVLGEAMSCALPCIATQVGDCARMLNGHGHIVDIGDYRAMGIRIIELSTMASVDRNRIGNRLRERIASKYSLEFMTSAYDNLYLSHSL